MVSLDEVFQPDGLISKNHPDYEFRPQQLEMAKAVYRSISEGRHLIVEAGTGVGKSFAYLIPLILTAKQREGKAIVSTYTINLQEQLLNKDIPFLKHILPVDFRAVLIKGRSNYVCLRRFYQTIQSSMAMFASRRELKQLEEIRHWLQHTNDGSVSSLTSKPERSVWENICGEVGNCLRKRCEYSKECFIQRERRKMYAADIIIVNHSLFFCNLATGKRVLPKFEYVVLDEAHTIEQVATENLSADISNYSVRYLLNSLYNPKLNKGFCVAIKDATTRRLVEKINETVDEFFQSIDDWFDGNYEADGERYLHRDEAVIESKRRDEDSRTLRVRMPGIVKNTLDKPLGEIIESLEIRKNVALTDSEEIELSSYIEKVSSLRNSISEFMTQRLKEDYVYWVQISKKAGKEKISLHFAPIKVGNLLKDLLFGTDAHVAMTSATLSTNRSFDYFKDTVGLQDADEVILDSPFDYKKQVSIYISREMPNPNKTNEFIEYLARKIEYYVSKTGGKAMVLFTSYRVMKAVYESMKQFFEEQSLKVMLQQENIDRTAMLDEFRRDIDSVLFGTESFWMGVDVKGEALSNLIITKLPFRVPDHPVVEARLELIRERGGNEFMEYQLPEACIRFRQGFGRLIRNRTDRGIVVILDNRVITKNYGRAFLNSIPECTVEIE
jgi:ATP-dependent DNA helicase DinG